jgi:hypothetical protein
MINQGIHGCTSLRVETHYVQNANSVTLEINTRRGETIMLCLYDLPAHITSRIVGNFADEKTRYPVHGEGEVP